MASKIRKVETVSMAILLVLGIFFLLAARTPAMSEDATMNNVEDKAAAEAVDAKDTTGSWLDWAQDKISDGLGMNHENERMTAEVMDKAGDIAMKTKDKISSAASDAADFSSEKASDTMDTVMEKAGDAKSNLKSKAEDAKDMVAEGADEVKKSAERSYDSTKESAKANYDAAKEAASQASGYAGAKMQKMSTKIKKMSEL